MSFFKKTSYYKENYYNYSNSAYNKGIKMKSAIKIIFFALFFSSNISPSSSGRIYTLNIIDKPEGSFNKIYSLCIDKLPVASMEVNIMKVNVMEYFFKIKKFRFGAALSKDEKNNLRIFLISYLKTTPECKIIEKVLNHKKAFYQELGFTLYDDFFGEYRWYKKDEAGNYE